MEDGEGRREKENQKEKGREDTVGKIGHEFLNQSRIQSQIGIRSRIRSQIPIVSCIQSQIPIRSRIQSRIHSSEFVTEFVTGICDL